MCITCANYYNTGHGDIALSISVTLDSGTLIQHFSSGDDFYVRWLVTCMLMLMLVLVLEVDSGHQIYAGRGEGALPCVVLNE